MATKKGYLAIAISLTVLDGLIAVYYGRSFWTAWSCDIWARGLVVMMTMLAATSLANIWAQAISKLLRRARETQGAAHDLSAITVPIESRGERNV